MSINDVVELVRTGKLPLGAEFERLLQYLAVALAAVVNVFNPSRLFVYGRCLDADERLWDWLLALAQKRALAPTWANCVAVRARGNKRLGALTGVIRSLTTG